jgi:subfamily B ATP-binding cassette protein HlyB/CyaB
MLGFVLLARYHGVAVDPDQLRHRFASHSDVFGIDEALRAAKELGLKARRVVSRWERLLSTPTPALAEMSDGSFLVVGAATHGKVLVQVPGAAHPHTLTQDTFVARWTGRLVLVTKRAGLGDDARRFDVSWFIPSLMKYRRLLAEVFIASLFMQVLALVTPLFFQVVIDKVLVHNGLTTLDVLAIGLLAVSLFEVILGGLRTYLFSHTASRVDVELGAKLYRHLQGLPIAFFLARPVGTIVARVRELESIRNFITSSALTLVIDLLFTVVFLVIMYVYSPTLFWVVGATIPLYALLSLVVTPILRRRLDEKFKRGAENQAFLVESVSGAETIKAMATEPQMQRRWEEQLAGYVGASFRALNLGNIANQTASFVTRSRRC